MKFEQSFKKFVCAGDTLSFKSNGVLYRAEIVFDDFHNIDDDDSHNVDQTVTGCDDDQQKLLLDARKAWFNDEWFYCGVRVSAISDGYTLQSDSLWGIEANYPGGDNSYLTEVANDLLGEVMPKVDKLQSAIERV